MKMFLGLFLCITLSAFSFAQGVHIGDKAPDFSLISTDDRIVSLEDYKDVNGVIVIFTCNHCPWAVLYEDRIIEIQNTYGSKNVHVVAINPNDPEVQPDDSFEAMKIRSLEKGFNFPYLLDSKQEVFPKYGATKTPHVFLLDSQHIVRYIGAIDDNAKDPTAVEQRFLMNAIDAMLEGGEINPFETKAIGCSIKVKK